MSDPPPADQAASNSLGLDLDTLKEPDTAPPTQPKDASPAPEDASQLTEESKEEDEGDSKDEETSKKEPKEKKKPYVNPDRVKTGGAQRVRTISIAPLCAF